MRSEHRHARAQHDARRAACAASQLFSRCGWRHAAVHRDHVAGAEALDEALLQLRREVDLGHHHQRLRLRVARQQASARPAGRPRSCRCRWRRTAGRVRRSASNAARAARCSRRQCRAAVAIGSRLRRRCRALQPPRQLAASGRATAAAAPPAQLRPGCAGSSSRQKVTSCRHAAVSGGDRVEGAGDRLGRCERGSRSGGRAVVPDHAQHLAPAQRHAHQRARRKWQAHLNSSAVRRSSCAPGWGRRRRADGA